MPSYWSKVYGVPQRSVHGHLFNIFINYLNEEVVRTIIKSVDDAKLNEIDDILKVRNKIQNDVDKQEKWTENNEIRLKR